MEVEIKDFEERDREELNRIYLEVRKTNFTWLSQQSLLSSSFDKDTDGEFILVAKLENEIVGFASIWLQDNFLHHLYISNEFQSKGIGTQLLNSVIERANADITLKCFKKNKLGIKFYRRHGWTSVSQGESNEGKYILFRYLNKITKNTANIV